MFIQIAKDKKHWRFCAKNGQILAHSERYYTAWNCKRQAEKLAHMNHMELKYES